MKRAVFNYSSSPGEGGLKARERQTNVLPWVGVRIVQVLPCSPEGGQTFFLSFPVLLVGGEERDGSPLGGRREGKRSRTVLSVGFSKISVFFPLLLGGVGRT